MRRFDTVKRECRKDRRWERHPTLMRWLHWPVLAWDEHKFRQRQRQTRRAG